MIVGLLALGAVVAVATAGTGAISSGDAAPDDGADTWTEDDDGNPVDINPYGSVTPGLTMDQSQANLSAFLAALRSAEGGAQGYRSLVGGGSFADFSHHPGWADAAMTSKSAWAGAMNSHAAGAYQFQPGTFKEASDSLGLGGDFSPSSQDAAAVWGINSKSAMGDVYAGNMAGVVSKLGGFWTSLTIRGPSWYMASITSNGGNFA